MENLDNDELRREKRREQFQKIAAYAQAVYCDGSNDDIELEDDPVRDVTPDGAWVAARLWVPASAYEEDENG
jgi:hypothetical protein